MIKVRSASRRPRRRPWLPNYLPLLLLTLTTLIGICVLQLGILIAVSQLALHAGIAPLVLLVLLHCALAQVLVFGFMHAQISLSCCHGTPPISSRVRRPDFTLTLAARPRQLTFVGGTLLFLVGLPPFRQFISGRRLPLCFAFATTLAFHGFQHFRCARCNYSHRRTNCPGHRVDHSVVRSSTLLVALRLRFFACLFYVS